MFQMIWGTNWRIKYHEIGLTYFECVFQSFLIRLLFGALSVVFCVYELGMDREHCWRR